MLRFIEGFDQYGASSNVVPKGWTSGGDAGVNETGRFGGSAYDPGTTLNLTLTAQQTWFAGFALYYPGGAGTSSNFFSFRDSTTVQAGLRITGSGQLIVYNGTATALATSTNTLAADTWRYIEFGVHIADSTGTYEVRVDGTPWLTGTGADTKAGTVTTADNFLWQRVGGNGATAIDDVYIVDTQTGGTTTFIGDCRVATVFPASDGTLTDFTLSTGTTAWSLVDESPAPNTTDFVSSTTTNHQHSFNMADLPTDGTIKGVFLTAYASKSDAGTNTMACIVTQTGTTSVGTNVDISTTWTYGLRQLYETNPVTGSAWTQSDIETDAQFGFKLIT